MSSMSAPSMASTTTEDLRQRRYKEKLIADIHHELSGGDPSHHHRERGRRRSKRHSHSRDPRDDMIRELTESYKELQRLYMATVEGAQARPKAHMKGGDPSTTAASSERAELLEKYLRSEVERINLHLLKRLEPLEREVDTLRVARGHPSLPGDAFPIRGRSHSRERYSDSYGASPAPRPPPPPPPMSTLPRDDRNQYTDDSARSSRYSDDISQTSRSQLSHPLVQSGDSQTSGSVSPPARPPAAGHMSSSAEDEPSSRQQYSSSYYSSDQYDHSRRGSHQRPPPHHHHHHHPHHSHQQQRRRHSTRSASPSSGEPTRGPGSGSYSRSGSGVLPTPSSYISQGSQYSNGTREGLSEPESLSRAMQRELAARR